MRNLMIILLIVFMASLVVAKPTQPKPGQYKFTQEHTLKVATKYAGGRGIDPNPVEWAERKYKPGDIIEVEEFFWISEDNDFAAKVVFHGTNRSVPMKKLKKVK